MINGRMVAAKTPAEMERIREADAKLKAQQLKNFVPEKNMSKPIAYFEISRYTAGNFRGSFIVAEFIPAEGKKKAERKIVSDGVDMVVAMASLETSLRKRVFK